MIPTVGAVEESRVHRSGVCDRCGWWYGAMFTATDVALVAGGFWPCGPCGAAAVRFARPGETRPAAAAVLPVRSARRMGQQEFAL